MHAIPYYAQFYWYHMTGGMCVLLVSVLICKYVSFIICAFIYPYLLSYVCCDDILYTWQVRNDFNKDVYIYIYIVYWGTYVYLKSWCLYLTFRVLYNMVFVAYFRKIYRIFYGMTFILCGYAICLFVKCGIILCFKQGSKVQQFHGLVIPCINILEIKK